MPCLRLWGISTNCKELWDGLGVIILNRACVTRIAWESGRRWKVVVTHPYSLRAENTEDPKVKCVALLAG